MMERGEPKCASLTAHGVRAADFGSRTAVFRNCGPAVWNKYEINQWVTGRIPMALRTRVFSTSRAALGLRVRLGAPIRQQQAGAIGMVAVKTRIEGQPRTRHG